MNNKFWEDFQKTYTKLMLRQMPVFFTTPSGKSPWYEAFVKHEEDEKTRALGRDVIDKCKP